MKFLETITKPSDIKNLTVFESRKLAREIRQALIDTTSVTGGHLSSNLGVVELTIALHQCFDSPTDKIIWDVGHQAYVHKILTGRLEQLKTIRQFNGLSGFPKRSESIHDIFDTGHSSTSLSAAVGIAAARDIKGDNNYVIPVIGDGALSGGMAYEALNNVSAIKGNFIVILNDNQMSISPNVGGMAVYLDKFRTGQFYNDIKSDVENTLTNIPHLGQPMIQVIRTIKNGVKQLVVPGMLFEEMGFKYLGPIDGHDFKQLRDGLQQAKAVDAPVILHVKTIKGKGYKPAEIDPSKFHGVKPFNKNNGDFYPSQVKATSAKSYSQIVGDTLEEIANVKPNVVAITAAMCSGCGLTNFSKRFQNRFFDVGIAEQHAVTFAAGLATQGMKPFFVVYSSFLQRAYDQVIHDVCIQNLPVVFCIDRAGLVGEDGETHQGVFDLSFLSHIPNLTIMTPKSGDELRWMLRFASGYEDGPIAIRYPKGLDNMSSLNEEIELGKVEWISKNKQSKVLLVSVGSFYEKSLQVYQKLQDNKIITDVVNLRFVKPIDDLFINQLSAYDYAYVLEDNMIEGGVTSLIARRVAERIDLQTIILRGFGMPDNFVTHGKINELHQYLGLDSESISRKIIEEVTGKPWQKKND